MAAGGVLVRGTGSNPGVTQTGPGTSGQVLTSNGARAVPTFQTPSTPSGAFYMSPLTTGGDPTTAELIFAPDGDVVMVPVAF